MTPDELDQLLEQASAPTEPADEAYADRLEARLMAVHGSVEGGHATRASARLWIRPAVAAACVAVLLTAVALAAPSRGNHDLVLDAASDARVTLPDGSVVAAEPGLTLPDGTTITAGDDPLTIDGRRVEPGETVVIVDGRVRSRENIDEPASPPVGPVGPVGGDRPAVDSTTTSTTDSGPGPPTTRIAPPPNPPPTSTTPTTRPTTTTTVRPAEPERLSLSASRRAERRIALTWSTFRGPGFARYVVVRTVSNSDDPPPRPLRPTDGQQVFAATSPRTVTTVDVLPRDAVSAAYRVFVLDGSGVILGISNIAPA